ncbi:MAG: hypothetical protein AB8D78_05905 [Akkermansiaceae bacterium]
MTNRRQLSLEVAQMGKVWVASFTLLGISAIGATESDAINAVFDAFKTHNLGNASSPQDCEACS